MLYKIYKLHFTTPVRFGKDAESESQITFCSDTLFSACYLGLMEEKCEDSFYDAVDSGDLRFSDALPYAGNQFYLPRPTGLYARRLFVDTDPSLRKLMKKIHYVSTELYDSWLEGKVDPEKLLVRFGSNFERTRVNMRGDESLPYQVEGFRFYEDCGLYIIVAGRNADALNLMDRAMGHLTATGIGGKVSSGWGHFVLDETTKPDPFLERSLDDEVSPNQMLLSVAFPKQEEADNVMQDAHYLVNRRGGFTAGYNEKPVKKQTTWMLASGSVFHSRFDGIILNVAGSSPHPVWRCGKTLMMGVKAI